MDKIIERTAHLGGDGVRAFRALCALLSDASMEVDWRDFSPPDWLRLREMAQSEGVAEMAYYRLTTQPDRYRRDLFDPKTYRSWAEQEAATALRNALLFRQVTRLVQALSEIEVPVVLLKGSDLAWSVYPQPGLRPMSDVDVLVPETKLASALAQLKCLGYVEHHPEALLGLEKLFSQNAYLHKPGAAGAILELHWTLVGTPAFRYTAPMEWFWQHVEPRECALIGQPADAWRHAFTLEPNANLLYLAAHQMLQHGMELASLRWLLDVHLLVIRRAAAIDWDALADQARQFGWSGALRVCLSAVQECFGTLLPEGFLSRLSMSPHPLDQLVEMRASPTSTHTQEMWRMLVALKWHGRLRLVMAMLFPGKVYLCWRYQPKQDWFWLVYHLPLWGYIARDGWRTLWGWLIRSFSK